ncbi:MAG TPA: glycosyl hydrolase [Mucilaginibacter sp.]|jgi:hypothetical protein
MKKLFIILLLFLANDTFAQKDTLSKHAWLQTFDFNPSAFNKPPLQFGPFARWWWPGNAVEPVELKREINLFADNHFGGVEIQPLNLFIPGGADVRAKVQTWDTPDYYANVIAVMQEARKRGLTVDMTDGSGWPPGGPYLSADDGFLTLAFAEVDVKGNNNIAVPLPTVVNNTGVPAKLQAVLGVKVSDNSAASKSSTVSLDPNSTIILTDKVKRDSLYWKAPAGNWKIIAFWSKPQGEKTMAATPAQGPVMNHFDSTKVLKNYKHLFGERTGLQPYFGNPMRAVFDDSYEFAVDRHYSLNFIAYFKAHRGYDITRWLPAEMQKGYNFVSYMRPNASPDFSFSKEDWRLKYDYDLTLSELFGEQFQFAAKKWLEPQGLLHRSQSYGLNLDMMAQAGLASIPETESMLGTETNMKIMTSGGHLYNRPIESAESVVFNGRAYTNTPEKIKVAVDKLFASGVNQINYHGVPYRYTPKELGPEGWFPFSTPLINVVNFSSNLGEGNIFWKDQKDVNDYIARTQYALRSGKPHSDVLIYFPFMDVDGMPDNPEEIMTKGFLKDVEGPLSPSKDPRNEGKEKWAAKVYPLINELEANGITWEWVNDVSIQTAQLTPNKEINIRGNKYQALILAEDSVIQLKTADKIKTLAAGGMRLVGTGTLPNLQPSFLNWKENDKKTEQSIKTAFKAKSSRYSNDEKELVKWINSWHRSVRFNGEFRFTRQVERDMTDGSRIQFIWNKSDQWQTLALTLDAKYKSSHWLNAADGKVINNNKSVISYRIAPYGSIILFASTKENPFPKTNEPVITADDQAKAITTLSKWNLKADSVEVKDTSLFDWRNHTQLKFSSAEGIYTSSFNWDESANNAHYFLDLGKVYFTAEVYVNGKYAGKRVFAPYMLDITSLLRQGSNSIEVRVTTGQLNGFIGKGNKADTRYKQFKGKDDQLMAAGLVGPVVIRSKNLKE